MSSSSSSSSSLSRPRGGLSACRCLSLPRRSPCPGRFVPDPPPPAWALSLSRRSYSAFCSSTSRSTCMQLWRSCPLVRWILQYSLSVPSRLSATATAWQLAHPATSLPEPPAWAFLAVPSLPDFSTTSTSWFFFFLPFRSRPFLAGAVPSLLGLSISDTFSGEFPAFFSTCTLVGQGIKLADLLDLAHRHFLPHP